MVRNMRGVTSDRFQSALAKLDGRKRSEKLHCLQSLTAEWGEEIEFKYRHWQRVPCLFLGLWPQSPDSGRIAKMAVEQWDAAEAAGKLDMEHRVTYRFMMPGAQYLDGS